MQHRSNLRLYPCSLRVKLAGLSRTLGSTMSQGLSTARTHSKPGRSGPQSKYRVRRHTHRSIRNICKCSSGSNGRDGLNSVGCSLSSSPGVHRQRLGAIGFFHVCLAAQAAYASEDGTAGLDAALSQSPGFVQVCHAAFLASCVCTVMPWQGSSQSCGELIFRSHPAVVCYPSLSAHTSMIEVPCPGSPGAGKHTSGPVHLHWSLCPGRRRPHPGFDPHAGCWCRVWASVRHGNSVSREHPGLHSRLPAGSLCRTPSCRRPAARQQPVPAAGGKSA